jgi:hypothetical protein
MTKHHAYIVTWNDSATTRGWRAMDERHRASTITSVGWVFRETKDEITMTCGISDCGNVVDALTIPRTCITKMRKLPQFVEGS